MLRRAFLRALLVLFPAILRAADQPPSLLLITLDTTRADYVGRKVDGKSLTPNLDALARAGTRFARAISPAPLTLPAHCSLMTGLNPPEHGVRDNGVASLPPDVPTLAAALAARGYATAAFVSSKVLDRRFGLDRGFATYDDVMVAERVGEQGYPERMAASVTDAALAWAAGARRDRTSFLWVHYYDPHAPYEPPGFSHRASRDARYAGEIAYMDREIGRLLAGLPPCAGGRVVAAVADHGEMLGEHGEKEHGIFVYRSALDVPLILSGPGVPAGRTSDRTVGTRALPATLLALVGLAGDAGPFGLGLPGIAGGPAQSGPVYSESHLPASAYGWSPLEAATDERFRFIAAPRPELYDLSEDPAEAHNLFASRRDEARRLQKVIRDNEARARIAPPVASAELAASLRSLGYLSGSSPRPRGGGMDPKDGIVLLDEFDRAKALIRDGMPGEAVRQLGLLVEKSPGNVPFLVRLAEAQAAAGRAGAALETMQSAIALNPRLDFLHAHLARLHAEARRYAEAKAEWEATLELNPRYARAWLGLAEIAAQSRDPKAELAILRRGEAAGTESAAIYARMAELELADSDLPRAAGHAELATRLMPEVGAAWRVAGEVAEAQGNAGRHRAAHGARAVGALGPADAGPARRSPHSDGPVRAGAPVPPAGIAVGGGTPSDRDLF